MTGGTHRESAAGAPYQLSERALVVMARAPRQGEVKTRLGREIGAPAALAVYRELAEGVLRSLGDVERCLKVIQYTPPDAAPELEAWAGDVWLLAPQCDGSLGDRMAHAASTHFARGARQVVIVGTDCPAVDAPLVHDAFAALEERDVVFGPAKDGGYYLVGMRSGQSLDPRRLFDGVPWSVPETLSANIDRARELGLTVTQLREHRDVDSQADLNHWLLHRTGAPIAPDPRHD